MKLILLIGIGSFAGGICRYLFGNWVQGRFFSDFPHGTLWVNITGCFIIGAVFGLYEKIHLPVEWRYFLATGFCGGFTTFSAFSNETLALLRDGQVWSAAAYVFVSVFLGLAATFAGIYLIKIF